MSEEVKSYVPDDSDAFSENAATTARTQALCQCSGCGRNFAGMKAFDMHRVGEFSRLGARRCLSSDEMRKKGLTVEVESVRCLREGVPYLESMETWHVVMSESDRVRLAGMRQS